MKAKDLIETTEPSKNTWTIRGQAQLSNGKICNIWRKPSDMFKSGYVFVLLGQDEDAPPPNADGFASIKPYKAKFIHNKNIAEAGHDDSGYDEYGFDSSGFNINGFDKNGLDKYGRDENGNKPDNKEVTEAGHQELWAKNLATKNRERMSAERAARKPYKAPSYTLPKPKKLTAEQIFWRAEWAIGQSFPDGDPADYLIPWLVKHNLYMDDVHRAFRKLGKAKDFYSYLAGMWEDYQGDQIYDAEHGHKNDNSVFYDVEADGTITPKANPWGSPNRKKAKAFKEAKKQTKHKYPSTPAGQAAYDNDFQAGKVGKKRNPKDDYAEMGMAAHQSYGGKRPQYEAAPVTQEEFSFTPKPSVKTPELFGLVVAGLTPEAAKVIKNFKYRIHSKPAFLDRSMSVSGIKMAQNFNASKVWLVFKKGIDEATAIANVKAWLAKELVSMKKEIAANIKHKAGAPARKKEAAKYYAQTAKANKEILYKKWGKDIVDRVTARQIGGDDGFQWNVLIDGRPMINGFTQREVPHYKEKAYKLLQDRFKNAKTIQEPQAPQLPAPTGNYKRSR